MKLSFALVLAVLAVADVGAQFRGRLPGGSYTQSCKNAAMYGSVLTAECKDQNGIQIKTRLYVRDCVGDIENESGELRCSARRLPSGSYARTCTACRTEGSSLECTCRDTKQQAIRTRLDLASCEWGGAVENKDGHLQCD
jgi:hypothetical protein